MPVFESLKSQALPQPWESSVQASGAELAMQQVEASQSSTGPQSVEPEHGSPSVWFARQLPSSPQAPLQQSKGDEHACPCAAQTHCAYMEEQCPVLQSASEPQ